MEVLKMQTSFKQSAKRTFSFLGSNLMKLLPYYAIFQVVMILIMAIAINVSDEWTFFPHTTNDPADFNTVESPGFGQLIFLFIFVAQLLLNFAFGIIAYVILMIAEKENRTLQLWLVSPLSRTKIFMTKFLTILFYAFVFLIINYMTLTISLDTKFDTAFQAVVVKNMLFLFEFNSFSYGILMLGIIMCLDAIPKLRSWLKIFLAIIIALWFTVSFALKVYAQEILYYGHGAGFTKLLNIIGSVSFADFFPSAVNYRLDSHFQINEHLWIWKQVDYTQTGLAWKVTVPLVISTCLVLGSWRSFVKTQFYL